MEDLETKMIFVSLRAKGLSFDRIAKELEISKQTLITWSKELATEIEERKAIELENLREIFGMTWAQRVMFLGDKLKAIKSELEKRSLSELSTGKLFDLFMKYSNGLMNATPETGLVRGKPEKAKGLESLFEK